MSDGNVVGLTGKPVAITPDGEPVAEVVALLRETLAQAESGEIRAVGVALVRGNYWYNAQFAHAGPYCGCLLGASALLTRRIADDAEAP